MSNKIVKSEARWKEQLSEEAFHVTRMAGTEKPFSGSYVSHDKDGIYRCVCCNQQLFDSNAKFNTSCGWPSFYQQANPDAVAHQADYSLGMDRTEVRCQKCDAHLGHVFDDSPQTPTGMRYCINSVALKFDDRN